MKFRSSGSKDRQSRGETTPNFIWNTCGVSFQYLGYNISVSGKCRPKVAIYHYTGSCIRAFDRCRNQRPDDERPLSNIFSSPVPSLQTWPGITIVAKCRKYRPINALLFQNTGLYASTHRAVSVRQHYRTFYSASAQLAMHSAVLATVNPSVRLSDRLSVTRWH